MENVFVISGVAGMTGSCLAKKLLASGSWVLGFDNFFVGSRAVVAELKKNDKFSFFEYDLNSSSDMTALFNFLKARLGCKNYRFHFVNCAAVVHTKHFYQPEDTFKTNVVSMRDFLGRAIEVNAYSFINCSTSEVYSMKSFEKGGVRENDPVLIATAEQSLRTSYAVGKLMTEFFLRDAVDRGLIKGCSIRFANVYSPDEEHSEHIIPFIFSSILKNGSVILLENAKTTSRTFLHNFDSCSAVISLLNCEKAMDGSVYNVGTEEEISIIELVEKIASIMGSKKPTIFFEGKRSADPVRRLLNTDKIRAIAGWAPEVSLKQGLKQCWEFHRARSLIDCEEL